MSAAVITDPAAVVAAAPAAYSWIWRWAADNGAGLVYDEEQVGRAAGAFLGRMTEAQHRNRLTVAQKVAGKHQNLPAGAEFIPVFVEIDGAVYRGFVLKDDQVIWMGYSAGHGKDGYVWPATPMQYSMFVMLTQQATGS